MNEDFKIITHIDELHLIYDVKASDITYKILYMFLYQSKFYSYVEIREDVIIACFPKKKKNIVRKTLQELSSKNILFYRQENYILNSKIF